MTPPSNLGPLGEITCLAGQAFVVSSADGDVHPGGNQGLFVRDTRFLDRIELLVDGSRPRHLQGQAVRSDRALFHAYVPVTTDRGADPTLLVTRRRLVSECLHEEVEVDNRSLQPRTVVVELRCGADFAYIFDVKRGRWVAPAVPAPGQGALRFRRVGGIEEVTILPSDGAEVHRDRVRWVLDLEPRASRRVCIDVRARDVYGEVQSDATCGGVDQVPPEQAPRAARQFACSDRRFARLLERGLEDLRSLQLADPRQPADRFHAAGIPWYLTLFGRDALWATFMTLPFDRHLAGGTLRALARRQGTRVDPETEEQPGRILHEVRRGSLVHRGDLPPNYYGTIDATPLFVILLHEAWQWGLPEREVAGLLPNLEAALRWMAEFGDPGGDGFIQYRRVGARGLDNQGWKDSHDGIQFADGRLARPPIALVEVQAYAHDAAIRGADLLDRFGRDGSPWRTWAAALRDRFHERFWLQDEDGPYLGVAIDGDGVPVDAVASNMGHVLGSGLLNNEQAAAVARRLADPSMNGGWGLRTLSATAGGFNPLSYHAGSVWPHDTAIAAHGCAAVGARDAAVSLIRGLVAAGPHFDHQLPELFAGVARADGPVPVPYPAACRPQAWAAAAALLLLRACLRPDPAIPDGRLTFTPLWPPVFRWLRVRDMPVAEGTVDLEVDEQRGMTVQVHGTDVDVRVYGPAAR